MNREKALSAIDSLRKGWYEHPISYGSKKRIDFEKQSYSATAMDEIVGYLLGSKSDPVSAIEEFRKMVDSFCCRAKDQNTKFMFSIYYDVATDVLDVLLGMR